MTTIGSEATVTASLIMLDYIYMELLQCLNLWTSVYFIIMIQNKAPECHMNITYYK